MNMKRTALNAAMLAAFGVSSLPPAVHAVNLPDGDYDIRIAVTPSFATTYGGVVFKMGRDGAWNSSFTFGGSPPGSSSQGMTDDIVGRNTALGSDGTPRGSGIIGDGLAGIIRISVSSNIIAITSFSKDLIRDTAGGDFVQYYGTGTDAIPNNATPVADDGNGPCGAVVDASSTLALKFTNRLGAIVAPNTFFNKRWNVDDCTKGVTGCVSNGNTTWVQFTTDSISNTVNAINGAPLASIGDVNSDGLTDFSAILVTGGQIGNDWGPGGFPSVPYFEVWNVQILSVDNSPAVSLSSCSIQGIVIETSDPIVNAIKAGAQGGCSLNAIGAKATDGGAWAIVLGFLAGLRGLMWWRRRSSRNQA